MPFYLLKLSTRSIKKRAVGKENDLEYNYNDFLNEYYEQAENDGVQDTTVIPEYGIKNSLKRIFLPGYQNINYNKSIGFIALKSLMNDYKTQRRPKIDIAYRLWRIVRIWFLVYLIVAIPLWCTRGWCCCCLFCKFFKPRQTTEAAKKFLISNPPGIFKTKKGDVHYDPTEREKETYEEFDHFLKTN
ncbi:unnamed protein product [Arctia plantaginis]|uniref:Uncharacterized protein n=1 Tax=Arctia plantaginis TaxID=874455 RepID=A0A8S1AUQ9_ARCPL|nr:unnamed protein product [Arctia plantaginis]